MIRLKHQYIRFLSESILYKQMNLRHLMMKRLPIRGGPGSFRKKKKNAKTHQERANMVKVNE